MNNNFEAEKLEAQKRFEILPENLKKEMLADKNVRTIVSICQDYDIPEEKVKHVALLAGEVFLGYIKPEEIAHELNTYFDIDLQKSNFIEIELKQKIFNPLKADLEKIYNPPKTESTEEAGEVGPSIIKLEKEAAPMPTTAIPLQKPSQIIRERKPEAQIASPLTTDAKSIQQPVAAPAQPSIPKIEIPSTSQKSTETPEGPFIIHTAAEPVKPLTPQFPKETPSLSLKVDESLIQKTPIIKPVSVHLESEKQASGGPKFQMPVFSTKPVSQSEQKPVSMPTQEVKPVAKKIDSEKIEIPIKTSPIPSSLTTAPTLKQIAEQPQTEKKSLYPEQPIKTVHYSTFKTPLAPSGTPKKPEQGKEFINLSTFTKVSRNTVDLRQQQDKK